MRNLMIPQGDGRISKKFKFKIASYLNLSLSIVLTFLAKESRNSNMKQGGACIATVGDEAFRLMLFMCGTHVVRPILIHDSYMPGKSTFLNFLVISRI